MKTKLKQLEELLFNNDLLSINGCKRELGWKTKRTSFNKFDLNGICEWLRIDKRNSIDFIFENETINFK